MNTKRKRKKNRIIPMACALGIFIGSICNSYMNAYAEALPNFPEGVDLVSAADCIMSYLTSAGMFITNREWIDQLYTSFGGGAGFYINDLYQNGLLTLDEAGHYVSTGLDTALENQAAWQGLQLDELFRVSSQEAAVGGGVAATGAGTIAGAIGGVATTGALPLAIGVTGAYWGGISLGTLIAHAVGLYGKPILYDYPINEAFSAALNSIQLGNAVATGTRVYREGQDPNIYLLTGPGYSFSYKKSNSVTIAIRTQPNILSVGDYWQGTLSNGMNLNANANLQIGITSANQFSYSANAANQFNSEADFNAYIARWANNEVTPEKYPPYSKDIVTPSGNARAQIDNGEIKVPSIVPEVNPTGQSIVPGGASRDDWLRWANGARGNNANNDPDSNADIFRQIMEAIRKGNPSPGVNPDPGTNPNPTPTPTPVPKPDYDPENPDQPEYDPKETEGPQDVTNGDPWTTPDLLDRFPFCLPRDVLRCFEKLDVSERQAPSISWHFTTPLGIHFDFDLDLDDYEGVASILRMLELIAFIIGLALATRNLIGR